MAECVCVCVGGVCGVLMVVCLHVYPLLFTELEGKKCEAYKVVQGLILCSWETEQKLVFVGTVSKSTLPKDQKHYCEKEK